MDLIQFAWVQAGSLGLLILGGGIAIRRLYQDGRQDRREYLATLHEIKAETREHTRLLGILVQRTRTRASREPLEVVR